MRTEKIFSQNAVYQKFEVLKNNRNKRHKYGEFFVEGVRNINQAVLNGWVIESFLFSSENAPSGWAVDKLTNVHTALNYDLTKSLLQALSSKEETSEMLAVVKMKAVNAPFNLSTTPLLMLFDRPSNKGNLGTLLRSCDALGAEGLIITGHTVDIYEPDVISASMGSFFKVPFMRLSDNLEIDSYIAALKKDYPDLITIATTSHRSTKITDINLRAPVLFLIGNETEGLNAHMSEIADVSATIPMLNNASATSLNVSCAATVLLYEAARQRGF